MIEYEIEVKESISQRDETDDKKMGYHTLISKSVDENGNKYLDKYTGTNQTELIRATEADIRKRYKNHRL